MAEVAVNTPRYFLNLVQPIDEAGEKKSHTYRIFCALKLAKNVKKEIEDQDDQENHDIEKINQTIYTLIKMYLKRRNKWNEYVVNTLCNIFTQIEETKDDSIKLNSLIESSLNLINSHEFLIKMTNQNIQTLEKRLGYEEKEVLDTPNSWTKHNTIRRIKKDIENRKEFLKYIKSYPQNDISD